MKIAIIGSSGNIGSRYAAILKYLEHEVLEIEYNTPKEAIVEILNIAEKAIVCTQTPYHIRWCRRLVKYKIPFLCEKPVSTNLQSVKNLNSACRKIRLDARMVSNWKFVLGDMRADSHNVYYNFYNTGKDGTEWDLIQLLYLANTIEFHTDSIEFSATIDGNHVSLDDIARSYILMLKAWITQPELLWNLDDAEAATEKVLDWKRKENLQ